MLMKYYCLTGGNDFSIITRFLTVEELVGLFFCGNGWLLAISGINRYRKNMCAISASKWKTVASCGAVGLLADHKSFLKGKLKWTLILWCHNSGSWWRNTTGTFSTSLTHTGTEQFLLVLLLSLNTIYNKQPRGPILNEYCSFGWI